MVKYAEHTAKPARYHAIKLYTVVAMTENINLCSRIGYIETHHAEEKGLQRVYMMTPAGRPLTIHVKSSSR